MARKRRFLFAPICRQRCLMVTTVPPVVVVVVVDVIVYERCIGWSVALAACDLVVGSAFTHLVEHRTVCTHTMPCHAMLCQLTTAAAAASLVVHVRCLVMGDGCMECTTCEWSSHTAYLRSQCEEHSTTDAIGTSRRPCATCQDRTSKQTIMGRRDQSTAS